ncbi:MULTISPECIES: glycoside hydrolase family 88/105 protein [unclassified Treponema]|uniref:glycoside hydrolase family 88/105 protein n=1 Tax=unclassified Treponema TaxID=2638727 RepID=UPI0025EC7A1D|nr:MULTISPECIES: glycoside hydrolase family 88 protein [unclassified Treponema]
MDAVVIEHYIDDLMSKSTAEFPIWNIEKARAGKKSGWDYIDGCMIMALLEIYSTSGDKKYLDFCDYYEDYRIHDDGTIDGYDKNTWNCDELNGGKNLFVLYRYTNKEKYKKALDRLYEQVKDQPRTAEGNFWHKQIYPNQVWLDGLYMAQPFYMEYEKLFNNSKNIEDTYNQFFNVYKIMRDPKTGLYYHGYDSSKKMFWADKKTGLSKNFWLRSLGWFSMALLDTLNIAPDRGSENWNKLKGIFIDLCESMLKFQDKSGMWWQVPNYPGKGKNYLETSGSAIFAYSLLKGYRTKILEDKKFQEAGIRAFEGICDKYLNTDSGRLSLGGICLVAGLGPEKDLRRDGTFDYYMSEPIVQDDAKGVGPFLLAYNEYKQIKK